MQLNPMKELRRALRLDTSVQTQVGVDQHGEYKVYEGLAPENTEAPYISIFQQPGGDLVATYGRTDSLIKVGVQFTCWGDSPNKAWEVWGGLYEGLQHLDMDLSPYDLVHLLPVAIPQQLGDTVTTWTQVVMRYELAYAR